MKFFSKGQMLVEILVAVGVAVVALLAISRISSRSIVNVGSAVRQSQASSYARSAISVVKNIKNSLGTAAKTDPRLVAGTRCFNGTVINPAITGYCTIGSTEYSGRVTITQVTINSKVELGVVAEVQWTEGALTRTVKNEAKMVFE